MRIADAKALPKDTPVRIVSGDWAGHAGTLQAVRQYEGLIRACVELPPPADYRGPRIRGYWVWVRPAEIEPV
jgi:hypothetical protein